MPIGETKALRVLIVEDEVLLAMTLEDALEGLGHIVAGVATRMPDALLMAANSEIDFAVLDLNLSGTLSFPVADILRSRGVPFVFATGYGPTGMNEAYRNEIVLTKPYGFRELENAVNKVISATMV